MLSQRLVHFGTMNHTGLETGSGPFSKLLYIFFCQETGQDNTYTSLALVGESSWGLYILFRLPFSSGFRVLASYLCIFLLRQPRAIVAFERMRAAIAATCWMESHSDVSHRYTPTHLRHAACSHSLSRASSRAAEKQQQVSELPKGVHMYLYLRICECPSMC